MKQTKEYVLCGVFLLFITAVALCYLILPKKAFSENEKRYLAQFPEAEIGAVTDGSFGKALEAYCSDHIVGREFFVATNAYFDLCMGRNTAKDIYYCKDNYLINRPQDEDVTQFEKNLAFFQAFSETLSVPSAFLMIPSTGYLMPEVLPTGHASYRDDALFDLAQDTLKDVHIVDVRDDLLAGKPRPVCYRTDHHLTAYGNFLAACAFLQDSGKSCDRESDFSVTSYDGFYGTTWTASGYRLIPPDTVELWEKPASVHVTISDNEKTETSDSLFFPAHLQEQDKYPVYLDGNHSLVTIENDDVKDGTLLIIKDSYAHCFATFLAHRYHKIYLIDMRYFRDAVSDFVQENQVEELLYLYGMNTLLTDTNAAWLR